MTTPGQQEGWRIETNVARDMFEEILREKRNEKKGKNVVSLSKVDYEGVVQRLKSIKSGDC